MCKCNDPRCEKIRMLLRDSNPRVESIEIELPLLREQLSAAKVQIAELEKRNSRAPEVVQALEVQVKQFDNLSRRIESLKRDLDHHRKPVVQMIVPVVSQMFGLPRPTEVKRGPQKISESEGCSNANTVITRFLSPANRVRFLNSSVCPLGWLRKTTRGREFQSTDLDWKDFQITEIHALHDRTRLFVPTLKLLTGAGHLRVRDTDTTPSINTVKGTYYIPIGKKLKSSFGHYQQSESGTIDLMKVIDSVRECPKKMTLWVRCRRTQSLDETASNDSRRFPEPESHESNSECWDRWRKPETMAPDPLEIDVAQRLLDHYLPVNDVDLRCLEVFVDMRGHKERKKCAAETMRMEKDEFERHLERAQNHMALRLVVVEGLPYKEAAEQLGVSKLQSEDTSGTETGLLSRAQKAFREARESKPAPDWWPRD